MKTNAQLLDEITAAMADTWLTACERRVMGRTPENKHVVIDNAVAGCSLLFGPASADECRIFIHRAPARDALQAIQPLRPRSALGNGELRAG